MKGSGRKTNGASIVWTMLQFHLILNRPSKTYWMRRINRSRKSRSFWIIRTFKIKREGITCQRFNGDHSIRLIEWRWLKWKTMQRLLYKDKVYFMWNRILRDYSKVVGNIQMQLLSLRMVIWNTLIIKNMIKWILSSRMKLVLVMMLSVKPKVVSILPLTPFSRLKIVI